MKKGFVRYFIAIALIGLGTMLILDNIGVIESDFKGAWHFIYPAFFLVIGIRLFFGYFKRGGEDWIFGSFLTVFGGLLILGRLDVIEYTFYPGLFKLWPLLIVYIGFSFIGKSNKNRKSRVHIYNNDSHKQSGDKNDANWRRFSIGDHEYKTPNWKVEPMNLMNAAGSYYLDFTKAFISEEEIPITIDSWAGDVQLLLPENLEFRVDASVKAGEINILGQTSDGINCHILFESPNYVTATRKLDILLDLKAGSVRVDQV